MLIFVFEGGSIRIFSLESLHRGLEVHGIGLNDRFILLLELNPLRGLVLPKGLFLFFLVRGVKDLFGRHLLIVDASELSLFLLLLDLESSLFFKI